jgi:hypothetical protein
MQVHLEALEELHASSLLRRIVSRLRMDDSNSPELVTRLLAISEEGIEPAELRLKMMQAYAQAPTHHSLLERVRSIAQRRQNATPELDARILELENYSNSSSTVQSHINPAQDDVRLGTSQPTLAPSLRRASHARMALGTEPLNSTGASGSAIPRSDSFSKRIKRSISGQFGSKHTASAPEIDVLSSNLAGGSSQSEGIQSSRQAVRADTQSSATAATTAALNANPEQSDSGARIPRRNSFTTRLRRSVSGQSLSRQSSSHSSTSQQDASRVPDSASTSIAPETAEAAPHDVSVVYAQADHADSIRPKLPDL